MGKLYLILSAWILVKIILMTKVMNIIHKKEKSKITIHPLQFMLQLQNTKSKI